MLKRKFLSLDRSARHKYCASILKALYSLETPDLSEYNRLSDLLNLNAISYTSHRDLANRYHWHLEQAGLSLKEHHLLPSRIPKAKPTKPFGPIAIYLDHVRSHYNIANILRTVEALRIGSVHFSPLTPYIDNEKIAHIAQGAVGLVPTFQNTPLSNLPRPLIALDTHAKATSLYEYEFPEIFTLIAGNEESGISPETLKEADVILEIPMQGACRSINVACAVSIALSHSQKQVHHFCEK